MNPNKLWTIDELCNLPPNELRTALQDVDAAMKSRRTFTLVDVLFFCATSIATVTALNYHQLIIAP